MYYVRIHSICTSYFCYILYYAVQVQPGQAMPRLSVENRTVALESLLIDWLAWVGLHGVLTATRRPRPERVYQEKPQG